MYKYLEIANHMLATNLNEGDKAVKRQTWPKFPRNLYSSGKKQTMS